AIPEGLEEVVLDQGAYLLRLAVVSVVITRGEHVGAEHDASFDFRSKTFFTSFAIHLPQLGRVFRAKSITNTIESREIRRRFGSGDDVVNRDRVARVG